METTKKLVLLRLTILQNASLQKINPKTFLNARKCEDSSYASPEFPPVFFTENIPKRQSLHRISVQSPPLMPPFLYCDVIADEAHCAICSVDHGGSSETYLSQQISFAMVVSAIKTMITSLT